MKLVQPNNSNHLGCTEVHILIPAYSVGATDPEETRLVERHLKCCPAAAAELREYRALTEKMLYSVPLMPAPAHVHNNLMARIQESDSHPAPAHAGLSNPIDLRTRIKHSFVSNVKQPLFLSTALALLLLVVSNLYWNNQIVQLQNNQQQMSSLLEDHNAVLALIGAGKAQRVDLRQVQAENNEAMMLCSAQENIGFVYGENFSTLASGDTYQVWLVRENGVRVQGGVLQINNHGDGTLIIQLSEPFANFESVEITRQSISSTSQSSSVLVMQGTLHY